MNPFPRLYSLQKRPKPQICPKFVPAIVFGGSSQVTEICEKSVKILKYGNFRTNFDKFFQISVPLTGTPKNNNWDGGHLKPVTLKPVSRIFRIFRVFASAFSAFSAFSALLLCGVSSNPCFCRVRGVFRIFRIFAVSGSNR